VIVNTLHKGDNNDNKVMESRNTHRNVTEYWRGAVIKNKKERAHILIDVAVPSDRNANQQDRKLNISLCIEIQRMWKMKCMIVPIITGAAGTVTKY
jgi:hypothetical protein